MTQLKPRRKFSTSFFFFFKPFSRLFFFQHSSTGIASGPINTSRNFAFHNNEKIPENTFPLALSLSLFSFTGVNPHTCAVGPNFNVGSLSLFLSLSHHRRRRRQTHRGGEPRELYRPSEGNDGCGEAVGRRTQADIDFTVSESGAPSLGDEDRMSVTLPRL